MDVVERIRGVRWMLSENQGCEGWMLSENQGCEVDVV